MESIFPGRDETEVENDLLACEFDLPTVDVKCLDKVECDFDFDLLPSDCHDLDSFASELRLSDNFSPSCTEDTLENIDRDSTGNASDLSIDSTDDEVEVFNLDEAIRHVGPSCPKSKRTVTPITIMICDTIGLKTSRKMLRVLLDSGSMKTLIRKDVVPEGAAVAQLSI